MIFPSQHALTLDVQGLQWWFVAYLIVWGLGICAALVGLEAGRYIFFFCIVPYAFSIVYAYKAQKQLNTAGLYNPGAWQVIVGAFLLNPFLLGFFIPASVLWRSRRIIRTLQTRSPQAAR
jgi:hypothetical protein